MSNIYQGQNFKNDDNRSSSSSNNLKIILVTAVSTALITSVIVGAAVFSLTVNKSSPLSTFLGVERNNEVEQDELSRNFGGGKSNQEYSEDDIAAFYAVYFDTMFYYPKNKNFFLYETPEGINVTLNASSSQSESALISMLDSKNLQDYILLYTNLNGKDLQGKVKSKNELVANAYRIDFDYSDAIKEKLLPNYHYKKKVVLFRKLNNGKDIVIEYNGENVDKFIEDLLYLINSFKFNPENVEKVVRFDFGVDNFYVDMDRTVWVNTPSDQSKLFLKFYFNNNFEKDQFRKHNSVLNMVYTMINNSNTPDAMKKTAEKDLNYYKNEVFKGSSVINPVTKKTISGKNAYEFSLSYKNDQGQSQEFYYALIDTNHGFFVTVEFSYPSKNSNAYAEFKKVLDNLKFE